MLGSIWVLLILLMFIYPPGATVVAIIGSVASLVRIVIRVVRRKIIDRIRQTEAKAGLHREDGPAIQYEDGSGLYFWKGIQVPEQVILRPDQMPMSSETPDESPAHERPAGRRDDKCSVDLGLVTAARDVRAIRRGQGGADF